MLGGGKGRRAIVGRRWREVGHREFVGLIGLRECMSMGLEGGWCLIKNQWT